MYCISCWQRERNIKRSHHSMVPNNYVPSPLHKHVGFGHGFIKKIPLLLLLLQTQDSSSLSSRKRSRSSRKRFRSSRKRSRSSRKRSRSSRKRSRSSRKRSQSSRKRSRSSTVTTIAVQSHDHLILSQFHWSLHTVLWLHTVVMPV